MFVAEEAFRVFKIMNNAGYVVKLAQCLCASWFTPLPPSASYMALRFAGEPEYCHKQISLPSGSWSDASMPPVSFCG